MGFDDKYRKGALRIIDIAESAAKTKRGTYTLHVPAGVVEYQQRFHINQALSTCAHAADEIIERMIKSARV